MPTVRKQTRTSNPVRFPFRIGRLPTQKDTLPFVIEPKSDRNPQTLAKWLREHGDWVQDKLVEHGAILFRGFDVESPDDFELVARGVDNELKNEYLGTSPRDALTEFVFSASELPGYYPIPQHCEMSFTAHPPRRLFFTCMIEPAEGCGETPLADFRKVYRDLDPGVRERFETKGVRIVRNYSGPSGGGTFDLWQLKRWDEMFRTTDRIEVERQCKAEGFEAQWIGTDGLRLISTQPAATEHPTTGEPVWFNHTQVFHLSAAPAEYERIYAFRPNLRNWAMWQLGRALVLANRTLRSAEEQSMHCTFADGSEIPDADMNAVRDAIWKNLVITPWKKGDIVAIDNYAVSHGRLPYEGPRQVAVCWA